MSETIKVIRPRGVLDRVQGNQLQQEVNELVDSGHTFILIDCKNIEMMDSSGLSALILSYQKIHRVSGKLGLCAINDQIRMLLELTAMDEIFPVFPGVEAFSE